MDKIKFLDLGTQPIANNFLSSPFEKEHLFNLSMGMDVETSLVTQMEYVEPSLMFNENYVYHTSGSKTMLNHFSKFAQEVKKSFCPSSILEIGSNDGAFLKNFKDDPSCKHLVGVEPCGNFAKITNDMGIATHEEFWTEDFVRDIDMKFEFIYAANCLCHIQDIRDALRAVERALTPGGIFVAEDPSLLDMVKITSYDQIYDEHAHIFSIYSLNMLASEVGLKLYVVDHMPTIHGGSNRVFFEKNSASNINSTVIKNIIEEEKAAGICDIRGIEGFSSKVENSKKDLIKLLHKHKDLGEKIISYGATSKSTTVFNYCELGTEIFDYITDSTPDKQGKFSPGMHIPVVSPVDLIKEHVDTAFLAAWNFRTEILKYERKWQNTGGCFITHVPEVIEYYNTMSPFP